MDKQTLDNLVSTSQAGDKQAYAELIRRYYSSVYLLCLGRLGNSADAEDLVQDVLLKGFLKIRSLRQADRFEGWLRQIAKNECNNFLRRKKRAHAFELKEELIPAAGSAEPPHEELRQAVAALPGDLRMPLLMYYYDGRKVEHVAEALGVSRISIYRKLKEAIGRLGVMLRKGEAL